MSGEEVSRVRCGGKELALACDWAVGIGGALWSTGLELVQHLHAFRGHYARVFKDSTVVELGTGTGLVGLAVAAMFEPARVVLTDNQEHLPIIRRNVQLNAELLHRRVDGEGRESVVATCELLDWSRPEEFDLGGGGGGGGGGHVDVVIGTDVVYNKSLYDMFISTLLHLCSPRTVVLMGITRTDTDRSFFDKLAERGFTYTKIPEYSCPKEYQSTNFGLFVVQKRS